MENMDTNSDFLVDDKYLVNSATFIKGLYELKNKLCQLLEDAKKTTGVTFERKNKNVKKTKQEKLYQVNELHKEFVKKHQITETITEKQLESYLQYYFDVSNGSMKPLKDDVKRFLNIPMKEYLVMKKAFDENKVNVLPKKEDFRFFMGLLENKKVSVDYNNATYNLLDPKGLVGNKELFTVSHNGDKIKPKTLYTFNPVFAKVLKDYEIVSSNFDTTKQYTESTLIELFNKYNFNQVQLYQSIDLKNLDLLTTLGVDPMDYVVMDFVYMRPRVLKDYISKCSDGNNLLPELVEKLEKYKLSTTNALSNYLKIITVSE